MFSKKIKPEITTDSFTTLEALPVIPEDTIEDFIYGRRGPKIVNPDSIMNNIRSGSCGEIVGIWYETIGQMTVVFMLNRKGELLNPRVKTNQINQFKIADKLFKEKAYEYIKFAAGPNVPLADIIAKL